MLRQEKDITCKPQGTISDHVREMHAQGVSPEMIAWRLKLKHETVLRWVAEDSNNL